MMKKLIRQSSEMYGFWWIRVYQLMEGVTLAIMTVSEGEPEKDPQRKWWGQVCKNDEWMKDFQKELKKNSRLSSHVIAWSEEMLGEGIELMNFYEKDFDAVFELIAEALSEYEA